MDNIRLLVGLGNPGPDYERTRHNAGYWWVDAIVHARKGRWAKESKFHGWVAKVSEGEREFKVLKPATYMNESGRSVGAFLRFHRIEPREMLVIHDELDLAPGVVKLKLGGGTGGHNGLNDLFEHLGTKDFWRLRIGIGHPGDKDLVADYVLDKPRRIESDLIGPAFERSLELLPRIANGRMNDAMTWLHTIPRAASVDTDVIPAKPAPERLNPGAGTQLPKTEKKP